MPDRPPLRSGDVYVYCHANGAIDVEGADGRGRRVTLADAVEAVEEADAAGARVVVAGQDTPIARHAVGELQQLGVLLHGFEGHPAPRRWPHGTDALMQAAEFGTDEILDDLVARGVDVHARDDYGGTALHHAARHGNVHAVEALAAAGADVDAANLQGYTPYAVAALFERSEVLGALERLGARPAVGTVAETRFSSAHTMAIAFLPVVVLLGLIAVVTATWPPSVFTAVGVVVVLAVWWRLAPARAVLAGGVPVRLRNETLTLRTYGLRNREVDLGSVTLAGMGGSVHMVHRGARWILLAHPDGQPVDDIAELNVPPEEVEAYARHGVDRVVAVSVYPGVDDDLYPRIGDVLAARGAELTPSFRRHVAWAERGMKVRGRRRRDRPD